MLAKTRTWLEMQHVTARRKSHDQDRPRSEPRRLFMRRALTSLYCIPVCECNHQCMAPTWRSFKSDDGLTGRAPNLCPPAHKRDKPDVQVRTHENTDPVTSVLFFSQAKPQSLSGAHTFTVRQQGYHVQAISMPCMSKTQGRCTAGEIPGRVYSTHCWPLHTADLRYI